MKISIDEKWLPTYEALASDVRLKIINMLSVKSMNIKEIAESLDLSSAIITMHIKKLEKGGIVKSERVHKEGSTQKVCSLALDRLEIEFPYETADDLKFHQLSIPIGHYTDFDINPTCGLATTEKIIGYFDDPRYFIEPERVNASILWFTKGYIEYRIPNFLLSSQIPEALEISLEISSEAPEVNDNWPSDISFFINGVKIGYWTSPGDFGYIRGKYTPSWWRDNLNQYGLLKILKINSTGSYIDGQKISDITLNDINIEQKQLTFRISVLEDSEHIGGVTLFGKNFGNYNQDIDLKIYYKEVSKDK